ncbi:hypothetical protein Tco_1507139 [Tanacetum coccineum]
MCIGGSNDDIEDGDDSDEDSDVNSEEEDGPLGATNEDTFLENVGVPRNSDNGPHILSEEGSTSNSRKKRGEIEKTNKALHYTKKKRYASLRLIDPLNGIAPLPRKKKAATSTILNPNPGRYQITIEVNKTMKVGNALGFNMVGKEKDVAHALGTGLDKNFQ